MIALPRRMRRLRLESLESRVNPVTHVVTNTSSDPVMPGSLAFAIEAANEIIGPDEIVFDSSVFGPGGIQTIRLSSELPSISDDLTIQGPSGIRLSIERDPQTEGDFRIFTIDAGNFVRLIDLRIAGGRATATEGSETLEGGGIRNSGELEVIRCLVENNTATLRDGGFNPGGFGGGIWSNGLLSLIDSVVAGNSAFQGGGVLSVGPSFNMLRSALVDNAGQTGVAAFLSGSGFTANIFNSTISGNFLTDTEFGPGTTIFAQSSGGSSRLRIEDSTIASNRAQGSSSGFPGGVAAGVNSGVAGAALTVTYRGNIFDDNDGDDLGAINQPGNPVLTSQGNNLSSDGTANLDQPTDLNNVSAGLRPLGNYGGLVPTHALLPDSRAINAGSGTGTDARGVDRGAAPDIGAFEAAYTLAVVSGDNQIGRAGTSLAEPIVAQLTENGLPVAGIQVQFFPAGDSGFSFAGFGASFVGETDPNGLVVTPTANLPTFPQVDSVLVVVSQEIVTSFTATTTPDFAVGYIFAPPPASVESGALFFVDVRVVDQFGNPDALFPSPLLFSSTDPAAILPPRFEFDYENRPARSPPGFFRVSGFTLFTPGNQSITAQQDFGEGLGEPMAVGTVFVVNTKPPPTLDLRDDDEFANEDQPYQRAGRVVDADEMQPVSLVANFGDGTVVDVPLAADGSFVLRHTYADEGSFLVIVTASVEGATTDEVTFFVDVLLSDVPTTPAVKAEVEGDSTALVVAPGVSVLYENNGDTPVFIIIAAVPERVADRLDTTFFTSSDKEILNSFDVRVIDASPRDKATIRFQFTPDPRQIDDPILTYFNRSTSNQEPVESDVFRYDAQTRTFTFVLDARSTPSLQSLSGTVFTISAQVNLVIAPNPTDGEGRGGSDPVPRPVPGPSVPPITPPPPIVVPPSPVATAFSVTTGLVQAALILGGQSSLLVSERAKNELAVALSEGAEGGERTARDTAASSQSGQAALVSVLFFGAGSASEAAALLAAAESGPLRELPAVPPVLTDLPSVTVTPAAADSISATPPPATKPTTKTPPAPPAGAPGGEEEEFEEEAAPLLDVDAFLLSALAPALYFHSRRRQRRRDDLLVVAGIDRLVRERRV